MNQEQRSSMDRIAGMLFILAFLLICAQGIYLAHRDHVTREPTNTDCWLIMHDGIEVPPFTARDCRP